MTSQLMPLVYVMGIDGTIATMGKSRLDYTEYDAVGIRMTIHEMVERIPEARQLARLKTEDLGNIPGTSVEVKHWLDLARRINQIFAEEPEVAGVAITHGTATLEETAYFLNLTVKSPKPVVVTGAMRPPSALGTDADVNLLDSIRVAACPEAARKGVLTVLNNEIQAARHVTKTNTYRVETYRSGDFGFLGYADSDHQVVFYQAPTRKHTYETEFDVDNVSELPRVEIAYASAGCDGIVIRALTDAGVSGIISAGSGSGGAPPDFVDALEEAHRRGVAVVKGSSSGNGRVVVTSSTREKGFVVSDNLTVKKARILLMLALGKTRDSHEIQRMFNTY